MDWSDCMGWCRSGIANGWIWFIFILDIYLILYFIYFVSQILSCKCNVSDTGIIISILVIALIGLLIFFLFR